MKIRHTGRDGREIGLATPAKVNFFFELLGKRDDGFHEIETVMSTVSLFDELEFSSRDDGQFTLTIDQLGCTKQDSIPTDESNLILKAMLLLKHRHGKQGMGCDVLLRKRIPSAAGLGGASGNAAGAILAANHIWQLGLSPAQLGAVAAEIGSDVPFFLYGGTARCHGRGEKIEPVEAMSSMSIVIAKPDEGLSTGDVYGQCLVPNQPVDSKQILSALRAGNCNRVRNGMFNRLESFAMSMTPAIGKLKETFDRLDCVGHQMSGSGTSYFGLFRNAADALRAAKIATTDNGNTIFACSTTSRMAKFPGMVESG